MKSFFDDRLYDETDPTDEEHYKAEDISLKNDVIVLSSEKGFLEDFDNALLSYDNNRFDGCCNEEESADMQFVQLSSMFENSETMVGRV